MALDQSRAKKIGLISAVLIPLLLVVFLVGWLVFKEQPSPAVYYPEDDVPEIIDNVVPGTVPGTVDTIDMPSERTENAPVIEMETETPVLDTASE